jgi:uncharacterized membrane protein YhaH (DUF805 family)
LPDQQQLVWLFFRFSGRVSRAAYFLSGLLLALIPAFFLYRFALVPEESAEARFWSTAFFIAFFIALWSNIAISAKRLHDLGRPGVFSVALFIPVISIIAFIALCLMPGDPGPNRYGARTNQPA